MISISLHEPQKQSFYQRFWLLPLDKRHVAACQFAFLSVAPAWCMLMGQATRAFLSISALNWGPKSMCFKQGQYQYKWQQNVSECMWSRLDLCSLSFCQSLSQGVDINQFLALDIRTSQSQSINWCRQFISHKLAIYQHVLTFVKHKT